MLRKLSYFTTTVILTVSTSTSYAFTCHDYFRPSETAPAQNFDAIFENTTHTIRYEQSNNSLEISRPPVHAYALEIEAGSLLRNLQRQGIKVFQRFQTLVDRSFVLTRENPNSTEARNLEERLHNIQMEVNDAQKSSAPAVVDYIKSYIDSVKTRLYDAENLAFKLSYVEATGTALTPEAKRSLSLLRNANYKLIVELKKHLSLVDIQLRDAELVANGATNVVPLPSRERDILNRLEATRNQRTANPQVDVTVTKDNRTPPPQRSDRYTRDVTPRVVTRQMPPQLGRTPMRDSMPQSFRGTGIADPSIPVARGRMVEPILTASRITAQPQSAPTLETYHVAVKSKPSRTTDRVHDITLRAMRKWILDNKLAGKITVSHSGRAEDPVILDIKADAPKDVLEKFTAELKHLILSTTPVQRAERDTPTRQPYILDFFSSESRLRDLGEGFFGRD